MVKTSENMFRRFRHKCQLVCNRFIAMVLIVGAISFYIFLCKTVNNLPDDDGQTDTLEDTMESSWERQSESHGDGQQEIVDIIHEDNDSVASLLLRTRLADTTEHTRNKRGDTEDRTSEIFMNTSEPNVKDASGRNLNVLFLVADDMRPQINSYHGKYSSNPSSSYRMHTPNLDRLAHSSLQLNRAYVQYSLCNPSRASFMTSRRPDTTKVWDLTSFWRTVGGNFTTLPQYFKENGYYAAGFGKLFHPIVGLGKLRNDPISWSVPHYNPKYGRYYQDINKSWWAVPKIERDTRPLFDEDITNSAIQMLQRLAPKAKRGTKPFFVAVGFQKPHMPFVFPKQYKKFYPYVDMELPQNRYVPLNLPNVAWHMMEGGQYSDISKYNQTYVDYNETLPNRPAKLLRRAYFSCVSFIDHQVGKLLSTLEVLGLGDNTIVSFIGDHGFHLGENGMWGKSTNMEQSTRAPILLKVPKRTDQGIKSATIVEFLDLFPTLAEAAGLDPPPPCSELSPQAVTCTEGVSFFSLVDTPYIAIKSMAISQVLRQRDQSMGYSIKTDKYRYTLWLQLHKIRSTSSRNECIFYTDHDTILGQEFYDHTIDSGESVNRVGYPQYAIEIYDLKRKLRPFISSSFISRCK